MNAYEQRQKARAERLRERAAKARAESESAYEASRKTLDMIPAGQPILVGHHSEKRHRRDLERADQRMRKSVEAQKKAEHLERRARAAESNTAISSDDPDAIEKLRAKIHDLEEGREIAKKANAAYRKGGLEALSGVLSEKEIASVRRALELCPWLKSPFSTAGNSAEIRRCKQRIAELETKTATPERETLEIGDVTIEESDNRVRIVFPGKPSAELRKRLKADGFRWAPSVGAWQRMASERAWSLAEQIVRQS